MSDRASLREVWVGLAILLAMIGLLSLVALAGSGPAFLTSRRTVDVVFRDGQGLRAGSSVRVAGIDAGRVVDIDLTEVEGSLRARVKISLPADLARKLRQDVKVTIQSSLSGQARINIVASGRSAIALVPGQVVQGVETTFFDPILEQVGLGPVERSHLSHTITEVRETVDASAPRIRQILATLQETANGLHDSGETVRPSLESVATHVDSLARRLDAAGPKIDAALTRIDSLTGQADGLLTENRPNLQASLASIRELSAALQDIAVKDRGKVERLLDGLDGTRARADRFLYQADLIAGQSVQILARNRADIERTLGNVRDATDWGDKLVQKIYANPFVLSPFYKPTPEDGRVQTAYDTAQVFTKGAQELHDLIKTLDVMQARARTEAERQEVLKLQRTIQEVAGRLGQTSQLLAESLKRPIPAGRPRHAN